MNINWIVTIARNNHALLQNAVRTFYAQDAPGCVRVLVVNNGSTDGTASWLHSQRGIDSMHFNPQKGVAHAWNAALRYIFSMGGTRSVDRVLVCNSDVELRPDTFRLLAAEEGPFVTAVGVHSTAQLGLGTARNIFTRRPHPDFSCFMIDRDCYEHVGPFDEGFAGAYCLAPNTLTLTRDLRWVPVGDLRAGDQLIAFDEHSPAPGLQRRYQPAEVISAKRRIADGVRITLSDGRVVESSSDHKWLAKYKVPTNTPYRWMEASKLQVGYRIKAPLKTWKDAATFDAGWLSGIFDGEGWIHKNDKIFSLCFAQKEGAVLERAKRLLSQMDIGYSCYVRPADECARVAIMPIPDAIHALGTLRPTRLLTRAIEDSKGLFSRVIQGSVEIARVESIGQIEVASIATTTKTLFADGLAAHNCEDADYHCRMHEAGVMAYSIDLPFLHVGGGAQTRKRANDSERARIERQAAANRKYFREKWGFEVGSPEYYAYFGTGAPVAGK